MQRSFIVVFTNVVLDAVHGVVSSLALIHLVGGWGGVEDLDLGGVNGGDDGVNNAEDVSGRPYQFPNC